MKSNVQDSRLQRRGSPQRAAGFVTENREPRTENRPRERGIALVIVLGVLTVILLIAVGFALSARTEAKSGSNYHVLVSAKTLTKMAMDRALMEKSYGLSQTPYSGRNGGGYASSDLTQLPSGNSTNDLSLEFVGFQGDFIDLNGSGTRDAGEPYWIRVNDASGNMIGRFAYLIQNASGSSSGGATGGGTTKVDLNAIGNIRGASYAYVRSNGFVGAYNAASNYLHGIAYDVNLEEFYKRLGYLDPVTAAQRTLQYRYGWPGYVVEPVPLNNYQPGDPNVDDNGMGTGIDDPAEYRYNPDAGAGATQPDKSISDSTFAEVNTKIILDPAYTNLATYATISSSDLNKVNPYNVTRWNLNNTNVSTLADVSNVLNNVLFKALPTYDTNQLCQWAVNIVDFHTTNTYPTVWANAGLGGTNTFIGVKRVPYLNQYREKQVFGVTVSGANAQLNFNTVGAPSYPANYPTEIWNPYPTTFSTPSGLTVVITNNLTFGCNPAIPGLGTVTFVVTDTFPSSLPPGFSMCDPQGNGGGFPSGPASILSASFSTNFLPSTIIVSNSFSFVVYVTGNPGAILAIGTGQTCPSPATVVSNGMTAVRIIMNSEADDPRTFCLLPQCTDTPDHGSGLLWYSLAQENYANPNQYATNVNTWTQYGGPNGQVGIPSTTNREGLLSFSTNSIGNSYASIADIGKVYRGEPLKGSIVTGAWQTIRLQPKGEWAVLDLIRVSDFDYVRGRINLNSDTNGPLGSYQSPALWALFKGINVPGYTTLSDTQVSNIVVGIANYRGGLSNASNPNALFTNIGQICEITNLFTTDSSAGGTLIPSTNDASREYIVRSIADLITTRTSAGVEILAWGQVIKGNRPVGTIQIRAWPGQTGNRFNVTKFQYIKQ